MAHMKHGVIGGNFLVRGHVPKKKSKPIQRRPLVFAHAASPEPEIVSDIDVIEIPQEPEVPQLVVVAAAQPEPESEPDLLAAEMEIYGGHLSAEIGIQEPAAEQAQSEDPPKMSKKERKRLKLLESADKV